MVGLVSDGRTVSGDFSGDFSGNFFWTVLPLASIFRVCAVLSWFYPSSICSSDNISRVFGKIDFSGAIERSAYEW